MSFVFERGLSPNFIRNLRTSSESGWWADVIADPKLFIALRGTYLNVYWHGQSLFYVAPGTTNLYVTTHEKYLLDTALASQVPLLADGQFDIGNLLKNGFISKYEGIITLAKMKTAASLFSGLEKTGCHEISVHNPSVIDCEIAIPGYPPLVVNAGKKPTVPRIDLASFESDGEDGARLVFWEVKHFHNSELRADAGPAPVCKQLTTYNSCLLAEHDIIEDSYIRVARNLVDISEMGKGRALAPIVAEVASGKRRLRLDKDPKVRLIIFGFNAAERDHKGWQEHLNKLKDVATVLAVGDAKQIHLKG